MPSLLDQLIQDHGSEVASKISRQLGIPPEQAAEILPAIAPALFARFQSGPPVPGAAGPGAAEDGAAVAEAPSGEAKADPSGAPPEFDLGVDGEQLSRRIREQLGLSPEQSAQAIHILVPVVLGFLLRRSPFGGGALRLLSALVETHGSRVLDDVASRLARHAYPPGSTPGPERPGIPTLLGRLAGRWFPRGDQ